MQSATSIPEILTEMQKCVSHTPTNREHISKAFRTIKYGVDKLNEYYVDETGFDMQVAHLFTGNGPTDENSLRAIRCKMLAAISCIPKMEEDFKKDLFAAIREDIMNQFGDNAIQILDKMNRTYNTLNNRLYDFAPACAEVLADMSKIENERFLNRYQKLHKDERDAQINGILQRIKYINDTIGDFTNDINKRALEIRTDLHRKQQKRVQDNDELKEATKNMKEGDVIYDKQTNTYIVAKGLTMLDK